MSKTDKTRPMLNQWEDKFVPGYTIHYRGETQRIALYYGGKRYVGGAAKFERKLRRRKFRQRERIQITTAKRLGKKADFDLKPRREDNRTIMWDLS